MAEETTDPADTPDDSDTAAVLPQRTERLEAAMRAGVTLAAVDDVDGWLREHTAFRDDGTVVVFGVEQPDADDPAAEAEPAAESEPAERETATQAAVKRGNPNLPAHVNRAIMNPVGGGRQMSEAVQLDAIPKSEYRAELREMLRTAPKGALRDGLIEQGRALVDRDPLVRAADQHQTYSEMAGDLLSV